MRDKNDIAVIDARTLTVAARYSVAPNTVDGVPACVDVNRILFAGCRMPQTMMILNAADGRSCFSADRIHRGFRRLQRADEEAYSARSNGTLAIVKEKSTTSFAIEQTDADEGQCQADGVGQQDEQDTAARR